MPNEQHAMQHPEAGDPWSDELAQWYIEKHGEHPSYTVALSALDLVGSETVVDIGCGSGTAVRAVAPRLPRGKIIGIDPTPEMIRTAIALTRQHPACERIDYFEAPAEELPIEAGSADAVFAVCSLHHWADIPQGLREVARVLKPAGRLIVVEDIFDDPTMGMNIETIRTLINASPFYVTLLEEQSHGEGRAHILLARLEATR